MEKLVDKFKTSIMPALGKDLKAKNNFEIPTIIKVVVSAGIGEVKEDDKAVAKIVDDLAKITGQRPKINHSRKAVSAFKLRIGQPVGATLTLRGEKMFDFVDRLISVALPRVRDFHGLSNSSFDGSGNYSIGIKDYSIFPEVKYEDISRIFGFQINIRTTAKNDAEAKALLESIGFPFEKKDK